MDNKDVSDLDLKAINDLINDDKQKLQIKYAYDKCKLLEGEGQDKFKYALSEENRRMLSERLEIHQKLIIELKQDNIQLKQDNLNLKRQLEEIRSILKSLVTCLY